MQLRGVEIETTIDTAELQRESDRIGNGYLHTDTESGTVYIEPSGATHAGTVFQMSVWLDCIYHREIVLKERGM